LKNVVSGRKVEAAGFRFDSESDLLRHAADDHSLKVQETGVRGKKRPDQFILAFPQATLTASLAISETAGKSLIFMNLPVVEPWGIEPQTSQCHAALFTAELRPHSVREGATSEAPQTWKRCDAPLAKIFKINAPSSSLPVSTRGRRHREIDFSSGDGSSFSPMSNPRRRRRDPRRLLRFIGLRCVERSGLLRLENRSGSHA